MFDNATVFFCDIVGFTNIASDSTAHQIIDFLNDLYNLFDDRIDNYDVYKVWPEIRSNRNTQLHKKHNKTNISRQ